MLLLFLLTLTLSLLPAAHSYANPGACTGSCNVHDPALIRRTSDGTYYRFSTGNRIQIATSSSISGPWTIRGSVLPSGSSIALPGNQDLWAPDVTKVGETYYLYYSVSTFGSQNSAVGVATSASMDAGTWTDRGATGVRSTPGAAYNAIDGNLVLANGAYYMSFGSFWGDIYQAQMNNPPLTVSGTSTQLAYNSSGAHALEGANIFYRSPYYYLFFSSGTCCGYDGNRPPQGAEYRINVCRSSAVNGPYVDANGVSCRTGNGGTTVLSSHGYTYGPGGQGVVTDAAAGGTILYYHYVDTRVGYGDGQKRFGWNVLGWSGGWPVA